MAITNELRVTCLPGYRFLLKSKAAEVIPQGQAQLNISFSCSTILLRGLDLLHQGSTPSKHLIQIAGGTYRLLPYALEYWVEHCLQYAVSDGLLEPGHILSHRLTELWDKHNQLLHIFDSGKFTHTESSKTFKEWPLDDRLKSVAHLPINGLMTDVLQVRRLADEQICENGEGKLTSIYSHLCCWFHQHLLMIPYAHT